MGKASEILGRSGRPVLGSAMVSGITLLLLLLPPPPHLFSHLLVFPPFGCRREAPIAGFVCVPRGVFFFSIRRALRNTT